MSADRDFLVTVASASREEREDLERSGGPLASDACVLVELAGGPGGERLLGWGDDYGTFHPRPGHEATQEAAERLLEAASDLWSAAS